MPRYRSNTLLFFNPVAIWREAKNECYSFREPLIVWRYLSHHGISVLSLPSSHVPAVRHRRQRGSGQLGEWALSLFTLLYLPLFSLSLSPHPHLSLCVFVSLFALCTLQLRIETWTLSDSSCVYMRSFVMGLFSLISAMCWSDPINR